MSMLSRFATLGGGGDPYWSSVVLLITGDGTNGSTTFTDLSNTHNTITNTGPVTVSTSIKKYGTGSMNFNGSSYLNTPTSSTFNLGTNNFTIECWLYFPSLGSNKTILALNNGLAGNNFTLFMPSPGSLTYYLSSTGTSYNIASGVSVGSVTAGVWYYFALVRSGTTFIPFLGTTGTTTTGTTSTSSSAIYGTSNPVYIGASTYAFPSYTFTGYMDDLRITNGVARYTSNFTVPTAALPIG